MRLTRFTALLLVGLGFAVFVFAPLFDQPRVAEPPGVETPSPEGVYDPVAAGEPTPSGFRQLLARDRIAPIYHPVHIAADEVDWDDDTLVIGIAIDDEAIAYPVRALNRRELVNDRIADTPILASW
jgi:hypothetical protein